MHRTLLIVTATGLLIAAALSFAPAPAVAQKTAPKEKPAVSSRPEPRTSNVPLGRTVRLLFKVKGGDPLPPVAVSTAMQSYGAEISIDAGSNFLTFDVDGDVYNVDGDPGRILVAFQVFIDFSGANASGAVFGSGSTIAAIGKETTLFEFADRTMVVQVDAVK